MYLDSVWHGSAVRWRIRIIKLVGNILPVVAFYLPKLIETNIRQRGDVGGSAKKTGKRIKELERLYGIQNGGNRGNQYVEAEPNNSVVATQEQLANQMGISVDTLNNYKKLTELIPELDDLVQTRIVILHIEETPFLFLALYLCET